MRETYVPAKFANSFEELPQTLVMGEVADLCSIGYEGALHWARFGKLRARKARGTWLVDKHDLKKFAEKRGIQFVFTAIERAI